MPFSLRQSLQSNRLHIGAVIVSLLITFLRTPLLNGTFAGLVVTVLLQLYLPGYLLARVVGKQRLPHPIARFAWILACGFGLTISMGAVGRLFNIPVPVYLIVLHIVMLVLALIPAASPAPAQPWTLTRKSIPLYIALVISCAVVFGVSYESRNRFWGFEDQPVFISLVDWMVAHPDTRPNDVPLRSRQIGVLNGDSRFDTDGWSYDQAAWEWASGVPARQIIWFDVGTLFIWMVPLLTFVLAYELTEREGVAAVSAVALTLIGLMTLDNIVYYPGYTAFGRLAVFQISVLRQMGITILLPLTLMVGLGYLRTFRRIDLLIIGFIGIALAAMHPIMIMIFVMSMGATAAVSWLAQPSRAGLRKLIPLVLVLLITLVLPFIQRFNREGLTAATTIIQEDDLGSGSAAANRYFLVLPKLPIVGTTYIRNPKDVFYHPAITLAVILALAAGGWWRRSLAARYLFSSTLLAMILFFTPGLTAFFNKFASSVGVLTTMFMIPVPLAYGVMAGLIGDALKLRVSIRPLPAESLRWAAAVLAILVMGLLIFEPFPIPTSARDQIRAFNAMQTQRLLHPAQEALAASLKTHLPAGQIAVLMTPYDVANVVIEELPDTLITSGRLNRNLAIAGNNRFMNEGAVDSAPWLDGDDLAFIAKWNVADIVTLAQTTRVAQMSLQPDRFTRLDTPSGYMIFQIKPDKVADAVDGLFGQMNTLYAATKQPRWGREGFNLILPGDEAAWKPIADSWETLLKNQPDNDRVRLGLAFTYTMMGADADALPVWQKLYDTYPDVPLYADALASTTQQVDPTQDSPAPLLASLSSDYDAARVLAARRLLTDTFFYRLKPEQLAKIIQVTQTDALTWDRLANMGRADEIRKRAALLMDAGEWQAAADALDAIQIPERAPEDMLARAAVQLVQGDVPGALAILRPATDPDQIAPNLSLHSERWENNTAAQAYYLLVGNIAQRNGQMIDARAAYQQASSSGAIGVGKYLAALTSGLEADEMSKLINEAIAEWAQAHDTPMPDPNSLLDIADSGALYVIQPEITHADEHNLTVWATYGNARPYKAFPIETWRIQVVSPDSTTKYAEVDVPAEFVNGALIRVSTDINLPDDIPELTPSLVIIEPRYNDAVTTTPAILPVVLNRPDSAEIPASATQTDLHFGDHIALQAYEVQRGADGKLQVNLYWQIDVPLDADYQVFVHVLDANGQQVGGQDSAPVNNQYPTSQWRENVMIADPHTLTFDQPLASGDYKVEIGLYTLPDGTRLAVTPTDSRVQDNSLTISHLTIAP
ncbi:MAG: hypothetical protein ABI690_20100 [Chloroflexota bacterium]